MDNFSEIEAKFRADHVTVTSLMALLPKFNGQIVSYKVVSGWDKYYYQGLNRVRHRCDGKKNISTLTCKVRKSKESIADRHEVDLPVHPDIDHKTVEAFLKLSGWKFGFEIRKNSYIWDIGCVKYEACVALYDVMKEGVDTRRFLEVEIDKKSRCEPDLAVLYLQDWVTFLQSNLGLSEPLNESLFELYVPKAYQSAMVTTAVELAQEITQ